MITIVLLVYERAQKALRPSEPIERRPPLSAIALLRRYLERHPVLKGKLAALVKQASRRHLWYPRDAVRHAQRMVDTFLAYHGWHNRLLIWAVVQEAQPSEEMFPYKVSVTPFIYRLPGYDAAPHTALAWTCWALLAYSEALGLGRLPYW